MLHGAMGMAVLLALAFAMSEARRAIPWRVVITGIALQIVLALVLLKIPGAGAIFLMLDRGVDALQNASDTGTGFVFGYLGGGPAPFETTHPENSFILAFRALPLVLIIGALSALLFYWGILQRIVGAIAFVLTRTMGIGGALGLGAASHIFLGMIEAPLLIRPYLARMGRGELFALMTVGMAGIAGTMMVLYASILGPVLPDALGQILIASIISTPAGLAVAALMIPFAPDRDETAELIIAEPASSAMDAIVRGTHDGIALLVNIVAMLIVLVALVTLINSALGLLPHPGDMPIDLQSVAAYGFRPIVWLMGVPWEQGRDAAQLMANKTILNEFIAYIDLAHLPEGSLDARSTHILIYALCGFANIGSVGILVGGVGAMIPQRRAEVAALGLRSLISGTLATCLSGTLAGVLF